MTTNFYQRCKLALTHPVTLGAVALLLVNDWLLKPVWSSDWTTGKISDFAWLVFFPPLLAFPLSLLARRNETAQRAAFLAAYAALPLLYAAYNTLAPLHDWIMRGFMLLSGASAGSPLDPWDSLVIPPAMALAFWVWRQSAHAREGVRARLHLYAVVIAALATVATSYDFDPPPSFNAGHVGNVDGEVFMQGRYHSNQYISEDGGLTWESGYADHANVLWGESSVETPRGTYSIQGPTIVLMDTEGVSQEVYSLRYLGKSSNEWTQSHSTRELRAVKYSAADPIVVKPYNLVYDQRTGNIVVGMGIQGVLVGSPDEEWRPYAVGEYAPTDFSLLGKVKLMFSARYLMAAITIALCSVAGSIVFVKGKLASLTRTKAKDKWGTGAVLGLLLVGLMVLLSLIFILSYGSEDGRFWIVVVIIAFLILVGPFILAYIGNTYWESTEQLAVGFMMSILGATLGVAGLPSFQWHLDQTDRYHIGPSDMSLFLAIGGLVIAISLSLIIRPNWRQLPAVIAAFVAMNVLLPLPFLLWLAGGVHLVVATLGALVLLVLVANALYKHLVRQATTSAPS